MLRGSFASEEGLENCLKVGSKDHEVRENIFVEVKQAAARGESTEGGAGGGRGGYGGRGRGRGGYGRGRGGYGGGYGGYGGYQGGGGGAYGGYGGYAVNNKEVLMADMEEVELKTWQQMQWQL